MDPMLVILIICLIVLIVLLVKGPQAAAGQG
jgi:hypothetical protein